MAMPAVSNGPSLIRLLQDKNVHSPELWNRLTNEGLDTMEDLAYACGPLDQIVEDRVWIPLSKKLFGTDWTQDQPVLLNGQPVMIPNPAGTGPQVPKTEKINEPLKFLNKMKVVAFICRQATISAYAKRFNEDSDVAPKLTAAERFQRRDLLIAQIGDYIPGLMKRALEPSQAMEDTIYAWIFHDRINELLPLESCTSQDQQNAFITGKRRKTKTGSLMSLANHHGTLSLEKAEEEKATAQIDSRLDLYEATRRLSITLHLAGVMEYKNHEEWHLMIKQRATQ